VTSALGRLAWLPLGFGICLGAQAQQTRAAQLTAKPESVNVEQVPRVPGVSVLLRGFNAGVTFSQVHDSSAGWYNVVTPAISYTFSPHYSADASVSVYPYRKVQNQNPGSAAAERLVVDLGDVGDTWIAIHAGFSSRRFRNVTSASFSLPSGDRTNGLSTGRVTFDFSNHIERYIKQTGLFVDVGGGDSSALFNRLLTSNQNSLGPLVHFQTGIVVYLPRSIRVQSLAYEQLPIGNQKVYTTVSPRGAPIVTVETSNGASEDNGFTTSLAIPLTPNFTLSSYYNRSLRRHLDTVSMGITYVVRGTPIRKGLSMIDRALREAAGVSN